MVNRNDIARIAGVSPATVSYVINNGPRPVSKETREKVLRVIRETDYQPSAIARNLRSKSSSTLGLIIPDTHNPYYAEVIRGIEGIAFENGYTVFICHSGYDDQRELQYVNILRMQRVAGVIWIPATSNSEPYYKLVDNGIPTIVLDHFIDIESAPYITTNNFQGGYIATEHLIKLGHKRIGAINRPVELGHSKDRILGYKAALCDFGIPVDESLIVCGGYNIKNGYEALKTFLSLNHPPTAIFAYNDIQAIGAIRAAYQSGIRIPQDLSIVGFDDIPEASFTCPALTTISQAKYDMGRLGSEMILKLINEQDLPAETKIILDVQFIERESTGPAFVRQEKNDNQPDISSEKKKYI